MVNKVCSDTGPIIHLHEIKKIDLLEIFKIVISNEVLGELKNHSIDASSFQVERVNKDQVELISKKYDLDIGEASVLYLCKSLNIDVLLTDDLDARFAAQSLGIKPVGSVGIILRGFREKIITESESIILLKKLYNESSLFITSDLIRYAIEEIKRFKNK